MELGNARKFKFLFWSETLLGKGLKIQDSCSWLEDKANLQPRTMVSTAHTWCKGDSQMKKSRTSVLQANMLGEHPGIKKNKTIDSSGLHGSPKRVAGFCLKHCLDVVKLNFPNTISHNFWLDIIRSGKYSVLKAFYSWKTFQLGTWL